MMLHMPLTKESNKINRRYFERITYIHTHTYTLTYTQDTNCMATCLLSRHDDDDDDDLILLGLFFNVILTPYTLFHTERLFVGKRAMLKINILLFQCYIVFLKIVPFFFHVIMGYQLSLSNTNDLE